MVALVDDEDAEWLGQWKWHASGKKPAIYAARWTRDDRGKRRLLLMHREVLCASSNVCVDHVDRDTLHNTRANLRLATRSQNNFNRKVNGNSRCQMKGVQQSKGRKRFKARLTVHGRFIHLGTFDTAEEAHAAYCKAAREHFGDFARAA